MKNEKHKRYIRIYHLEIIPQKIKYENGLILLTNSLNFMPHQSHYKLLLLQPFKKFYS